MKKFLTKRNIVVVVALLLVGGFLVVRNNAAKSKKVVTLKEATVQRKDVVKTILASGVVKAQKIAVLRFMSGGKLAYNKVADGDKVEAYQALMGLDLGDLQAAERAAYYRYQAADAYAKLTEDLVKDHASDESFTQKNSRVAAQTARDIAYDTWLTAQRALRNANLTAPFTGVATGVTVNTTGGIVGMTDGVTIIDPTSLYFEGQIDEADLGNVQVGQRVIVTLDAFSGKVFEGALKEIGFVSQISSSGATVYMAKVSLPTEIIPNLRMGMNGDGEIVVAEAKDVLALPVDAVINSEVTIAGKKQKVETGLVGDSEIQIVSGLKEGDKCQYQ